MHPRPHCVTVEAAPRSLAIDLRRTAVLVIDMQNDFGSSGGMLDLAGRDIAPVRSLIPPIQRILRAARLQALPIVYLKMAHRPDLSDAGLPDSPHWLRHRQLSVGRHVMRPDGQPTRVLIDGMWGTDILSELAPAPSDMVITKHRYSGFFETDLDARLRQCGILNLVVTGCTTSVCVETTVRDAMMRDYTCLVIADAVGQPPLPGVSSAHEASLQLIQAVFGYVSCSEAFASAAAPGSDASCEPESMGARGEINQLRGE